MILIKLKKEIFNLFLFFKQYGTWVFWGRIYLLISAFVISIILTKFLTNDSYGAYKYYISIFGLFSIFSLPHANQIVIRYVPRGYDNILLFSVSERFKGALFGSMLSSLISLYCYVNDQPYKVYLIIAFFLPFYYSIDLYNSFLQAKMNFRLLNIFFVIRSSIQMLLILVTSYIFRDPFIVFIAFLLSFAFTNYIFLKKTICFYKIKRRLYSARESRFFRRQIYLLSFFGIFPIFLENIDKILIEKYFDLTSLAYFSLGLLIGKSINGFFKPFLSTFSAKLVHKKITAFQKLLLFSFGTALGFLISYVIIPYAVKLFYGDTYFLSIHYAQIVCCSLGLYLFHTLYYNQAMFHRKSSIKKIYINNVLTPVLLIFYFLIVVNSNFEMSTKLLLLAFAYPLKLMISIFILFFNNNIPVVFTRT